jgi:hypothetical protein
MTFKQYLGEKSNGWPKITRGWVVALWTAFVFVQPSHDALEAILAPCIVLFIFFYHYKRKHKYD